MTTTVEPSTRRADSAVLRRIWRLHFWVGLFAAPVLVVLALSGLVILYSQPLDAILNKHLLVVEPGPQTVPLDAQVATAKQHVGATDTLEAVTPPDSATSSTRMDFSAADALGYPQAEANVVQVFVDPYTGAYLGQRDQLSGVVGWANQLHRMFGNDGPHVQLPSLGHLINPSAYPESTIPVGIGNLWMELTATWILVLLGSGIYLWWPRAIEAAKPLLRVRWRQGGRIRWRDVHALVGVVVAVILVGYVLSGMTWTRYWGENWRTVTATVTPSTEIDAPSTPAKLGDYDRLGRRIAWAATDDPIPASQPDGTAARLSYADIDRIAKDEHMVPGYSIFPPSDSTQDGTTVYGSYTVVNRWPQKVSEQRTLYLNQFTGATITNATAAQDGALSRLTSFGIAMHMGNQFGWLTRISATVACLGVLLSALTGLLMWWKRRPSGQSGLPGAASPATRANTPKRAMVTVAVIAIALGILFPAFGISLIVVLVAEAIIAARRDHASRVTSTTTSKSVDPSPE
ncbi:putative iron-regulated membrane protein [Mycolicibacterium sp. BK556]|uniref:PepSY-associated TM helix domain-containing protein n=1 Tax=unclassified Mycolicibacterium TaxID=2636767 RepID=UPI00161B4070|nr:MULTISPECIES: PepSY domain-containing protein [unclassified Mycolicibacterium]MBB3603208.1 putative iron-regulated membrane protein [Mycolicibacterium sp. BK556]MBB3633403.1 putative iron-regulated membrane protein [Mycolicibacterium sp. BK607]